MCTAGDGILTYGALRASGTTRRGIEAALASGALTRLRRGVYAGAGACTIGRTCAEHGGAPACVTAARHAGLWVLAAPDELHVWLRGHGHGHRHPACSCIEHWDDGAPSDPFGMPAVPRILRQILHCRGVEEFFVTLESALRTGRLTRRGLEWLRSRVGEVGRDAVGFARSDADSGLESLLRWRLRRHGLAVRTQVRIPSVGAVDVVIGDRLIVEVDGIDNHDGAVHRHKDLVRDANAAAWGYTTLRFDYALVVHDWATVELAILAHVDRGSHLARRP